MLKNFGPVIFFCTVIVGLLIMYEIRKSNRRNQTSRDNYWAREAHANTVRRKDISALDYISVSSASLPFMETGDDEINEYQDTIVSLQSRRILNLTGYSNTDLKELYGVANLPSLTEYDDNYTTLVNTISRWGSRLIVLGYKSEAAVVLEYGVSIGTDVSRNYYMLADLYLHNNEAYRIDDLINAASHINSIMKEPIINKLNSMKNSYNSD